VCRTITSRILRRVGVNPTFVTPRQRALPERDGEYLVSSNPRLQALRQAYGELSWPVLQKSQWATSYVDREVPLHAFRGDCAYVWQRRDLNVPAALALTAYYLLSGPHAELLQRLSEDGAFGADTVRLSDSLLLTRDLLDSVNELAFLDRNGVLTGQAKRAVLDIGAGYGRFAYRLHEAYSGLHDILCVDAIPESTFLCEYYLKYRGLPAGVVIPLHDVMRTMESFSPNVAINIHSFSECPLAATAWWLDLLQARQVKHVFIVPDAAGAGGRQLLSKEVNGTRLPLEGLLLSRGYKLAVSGPKYASAQVQRFGVTPTWYFLFELNA
jgi:hypothetical protein